MSFNPSKATQTAQQGNAGIAQQATQNSAAQLQQGQKLIGQGQPSIDAGLGDMAAGSNFFNTALNGNRANTTALLQPNIDQIRGATSANLNSINQLSPRGAGRSADLFHAAYAPTQQINSLYGQARTGAATALPQIGQMRAGVGLGQQGIGTNLIGAGNSALGLGSQTNQGLLQYGLQQQQATNAMWGGLGQGLFGLATTPFGGAGTSLLGRI